jgi:hypothetical protein
MSREVRKVPADWQHPMNDETGRYASLSDGSELAGAQADWDREAAAWARGEFPEYADAESRQLSYQEWNGERPDPKDYMPAWPPELATHFMMYETTSEGSPISPAFATPEELARWIVDNKASAFADQTASYEGWLRIARGGYACSAVMFDGVMQSGVQAMSTGSASHG